MIKNILLVEDNQDNALLFSYLLKRCGYNVFTATNAHEGIKILENLVPDIILSDISLPDMNGNEFLKKIRLNHSLDSICAIAVSAYAREEDKQRTLETGYDAFIEKPINAQTFVQQIEEIYEKKLSRGVL